MRTATWTCCTSWARACAACCCKTPWPWRRAPASCGRSAFRWNLRALLAQGLQVQRDRLPNAALALLAGLARGDTRARQALDVGPPAAGWALLVNDRVVLLAHFLRPLSFALLMPALRDMSLSWPSVMSSPGLPEMVTTSGEPGRTKM